MKYVIITRYATWIVEAEDIEEAIKDAYDNHVGYKDVLGVVIAEDSD